MTLRSQSKMSRDDIKAWLRYWRSGRMVNLAEVGSLEDMRQAQRFCSCMRVGLFAETSAEELWNAWRELIGDESAAAHEAECRNATEALLNERARKRA